MSKYKLTTNTIIFHNIELFQIRALKDFADVKAGDLGGYVQSEDNLSQYGDCWIYDEAKALHNASLLDNSTMRDAAVAFDHANMYDNSTMLNNSKLLGESSMFDNATMKDSSIAFGFSEMLKESLLSGRAVLDGNASSTKRALYITTAPYDVTISDHHIKIGVNQFTIKEWLNFTNEEIHELEGQDGLSWWKKWKPILIAITKS